MTTIINAPGNSTDEPRWVLIERRANEGAWLELMVDGESRGLELDADAVEQLRAALA